jgi:hypothetical protein
MCARGVLIKAYYTPYWETMCGYFRQRRKRKMKIEMYQAGGSYCFSTENQVEACIVRELIKAVGQHGQQIQYNGCNGKSDTGGYVEALKFCIGSTRIDHTCVSSSGLVSRESFRSGGVHLEITASSEADREVLNVLRLELFQSGKIAYFHSGQYEEGGKSFFVLLAKSREV